MGAGKACNAFETWRAKTAFEAWILTLRVRQFLSIYCNSRQIKALVLRPGEPALKQNSGVGRAYRVMEALGDQYGK